MKFQKISSINFKIWINKYKQDLMLNDEETTGIDLLSECNKVDEYVSTFKLEKLKVDATVEDSDESSCNCQLVSDVNSKSKQLTLLKIELTKFDVQLINWLPFWSQFSKINNDRDIAAEDKLKFFDTCIATGTNQDL